MALKVGRVMHGIMVPCRRMGSVVADVALAGLDMVQTTATQSGGRGGILVSQDDPPSAAEFVLSGEQTETVQLEVETAGSPPLVWPQVYWRTLGETDSYQRGAIAASVTTGFTVGRVATAPTTVYAQKRICRIPRTEQVALVSANSGSDADLRVFDPGTWSWGTQHDLENASNDRVACCAIDDRRVVILITGSGTLRTYISTDGAAPTLRGSVPTPIGAVDPMAVAWHAPTETLVLVSCLGTSIEHNVSRDMGASWQTIETIVTFAANSVDIQAGPDGSLYVLYSRDADDFPCVRVLSTPSSLITDADEVQIVATASSYVAGAIEPATGHVWCVYRGDATNRTLRTAVSTDRGETWTVVGDPAHDTQDAGNTITAIAACWAAGRLWVAFNAAETPGTNDPSVRLVALGTQGNAPSFPAGAVGILYTPLELPTDMGWSVTGTAPTIDATTGLLSIITAAATSTNTLTLTRTNNAVWAHVQPRTISGGAIATDDVSFELRGAQNTTPGEAIVTVRLSPTQFRIRDEVAAATLTTQTFDSATRQVEFLLGLTFAAGAWSLVVYWRQLGKARWETTAALAPANNAAAPAITHRLRWGHRAATTSESQWAIVQFSDTLVALEGITVGPYPAPLVDLADPAIADGLGYGALRGGPALIGETWEGRPAFRHGLDRAIQSRSPTLGEWRSTSTAEQLIVWDLGNEGPLGHPMALYASGTNVRTMYLEYYDGAAWQIAGTLDLAVATSLSWDADGEAVYPIATGTQAGRAFPGNQLIGWHFWTGTGGTAYRIRSNTPGLWGPTASITLRPRLRVDGEPSTAGGTTGLLIANAGVAVVHLQAEIVARYWRVRIPASQPTPEGYYRAAVLAVGPIHVLGDPADEGWQRRRRSGIAAGGQVRERPLRSVTWSWTDGLDTRGARSGTGDYLGPTSGLASVGWQDVEGQLSAIMDELHLDLEDGELAASDLPVLAIAAIPAVSGVVTDPTLFFWGEASVSVSASGASGIEGTDEVLRIDAITVSEAA